MVPVLMYHQITSDSSVLDGLAVPPKTLDAHLRELLASGKSTIPVSELAFALAKGGPLPTSEVALTFDDGFADFYEEAFPLLRQYGFTATVYVTTGWIQDTISVAETARPTRMLSWSQIKELADEGIEIAAHSHSHPQLDQISRARLEDEVRRSKCLLEDFLARPVAGMAYPFGYSNKRVRAMAENVGYRYASVVGNRMIRVPEDLFALPRLTVKRSTRLSTFRQLTQATGVSCIFWKERTLTKGYAIVRRTRSLASNAS